MSDKKLSELTAATGATGGDLLLLTQSGSSKKISVTDLSAALAVFGATGSNGATGAVGQTGATGSVGATGNTGSSGQLANQMVVNTAGFGTSINASGYTSIVVNLHDSDSSFTLNLDDGQMMVILFVQDNTGNWTCGITNILPMPSVTDQTLNAGGNLVTAFVCIGFGGQPLLLQVIK